MAKTAANNVVQVKPRATYQQQIQKLKDRGCIIADEAECEEILKHVNYYRLTDYFVIFKQPDDTYLPGLTFKKVYMIYEFDRKLRLIVFNITEIIEISFKARIAYCHSDTHGPLGYLDQVNFNGGHDHAKLLKNIKDEISLNSKKPFVKHHLNKYGGQFPIWAITELFTFGMVSRFYADMLMGDEKKVAGSAYFRDVESWLKCATDLRNICAHHGKLYGRVFPGIPRSIQVDPGAERSLWASLLCLKQLYPFAEKWNNEILVSLKSLFDEYAECIDLSYIHFPTDWLDQLKKI